MKIIGIIFAGFKIMMKKILWKG